MLRLGFNRLRSNFLCSLVQVLLLCGVMPVIVFRLFLLNEQDLVKRWNNYQQFKDDHLKEPNKRIVDLSKKVSCNDTRLMPAGTFPPIALASFPGSGNTWVRHLLETATGYATGSVYSSNILAQKGYIGEKIATKSGRALTIKTHRFEEFMVGAVLLVRNPYRAMIAEFNRQKTGKTRIAQENSFKTQEWHNFVKNNAAWWIQLNQGYISHCHNTVNHTCKSVLVVYYEQLQVQLIKELRRILEYLSLNVDQDRLACVLTNAEGAFHRPKRNQNFDPFSEEDKRLVDDIVQTYCNMINKEGLETPPLSFTSYPDAF